MAIYTPFTQKNVCMQLNIGVNEMKVYTKSKSLYSSLKKMMHTYSQGRQTAGKKMLCEIENWNNAPFLFVYSSLPKNIRVSAIQCLVLNLKVRYVIIYEPCLDTFTHEESAWQHPPATLVPTHWLNFTS